MTSLRALRVVVMAVIVLAVPGAATAATEGTAPAAGWGTPVRLLPGSWWDVSAAIDGDGAGHVVAVGTTGVWYATDRTGSWVTDLVRNHRSASIWRHVSLALDVNDRVTIALSEGFESKFGLLPGRIWRVTDRGRPRGSFSAPVAMTPSGSTDPSLKTPGHTYLALTGDVCFDVCAGPSSRVWYQTDRPGGWVRRRLPGDAAMPDMRVDAAGRPRLVYVAQGAARARIMYASAASRTGTFATEVVAKPGGFLLPRLVLDGAGRPVIAWARNPFGDASARVSIARRTGGDWTVRSVGLGSVVAVSVDAADRVHLAIGGPAGVREVTVRSTLVTSPIDTGSEVTDVELRYPGSGSALVAYIRSAPMAGVYVARR